MKTSITLYIVCSVLMKYWQERERNKTIPELLYRSITEGGLQSGLRINIKARQTVD